MKLLHFVTDDKFIDDMIELFDSIPEIENNYVTTWGDGSEFKMIKSKKVKYVDMHWVEENCIKKASYDVIFLHNLFSLAPSITYQINPKIKIAWLSWGIELYDLDWPLRPLIKLKNRIKDSDPFINRIKKTLREYKIIAYGISKGRLKERKIFNEAIARIDFYSGVLPVEFDLLCKNKYFKAKQIFFNYTSQNDVIKLDNIIDIIPSKKNIIQVGHSATKYLNHIPTFKLLRKFSNIDNYTIFSPLNYGDNSYKDMVLKVGNYFFGSNFYPLLNFMDAEEYFKRLSSVKIAIYNIERQSGLGNIFKNLWYGSKVFLPKKSITYNYFKSLGIVVFNIEEELNEEALINDLSDDEIRKNRKILAENYQYSKVRERLLKSLEIIKESLQK